MRDALLVALGGGIGSALRWIAAGAVQRWSGAPFPWGTFAVNAIGSLAIGLVGGLSLERALVPPAMRVFLMIGVLGGFTTFSAFSFETLELLRDGQWSSAAGYAVGSLLVCVAAAFAGMAIALRA